MTTVHLPPPRRKGAPELAPLDPDQHARFGPTTQKKLFCKLPFTEVAILPDGDVFPNCCGDWVQFPLGNLIDQTWDEVWNGPNAKRFRQSMIDGDLRHCDEHWCPHIQDALAGRPGSVVVPWEERNGPDMPPAAREGKLHVDTGPVNVGMHYEPSCNLACPTCRSGIEVVHGEEEARLNRLHATVERDVLPSPTTISLTGTGDPFASKFLRQFLSTFSREKFPTIEKVHLHTNAIMWTEGLWKRFGGIHEIPLSTDISIDAARPDTYADVRRPGRWDTLMENLAFIATIPNLEEIGISMTVQQANIDEVVEFYDLAVRLADTCPDKHFFVEFKRIRRRDHHTDQTWREQCVEVLEPERMAVLLDQMREIERLRSEGPARPEIKSNLGEFLDLEPAAARAKAGTRGRAVVGRLRDRVGRLFDRSSGDQALETLGCLAPQTGMRFAPDGLIHPCCVNSDYELGRAGEHGVDEAWNGQPLALLREAVARNDYSLGCGECGEAFALGHRASTHAALYDAYAGLPDNPKLRRVEFALSNTCNLQCVHCYGELSSSIRAHRDHLPPLPRHYGDKFFDDIRGHLADIDVAAFLGGEPFITRETKRVWDLMIEEGFTGQVHVTTNGTVWNESVEHYVHALKMNVAVSIDGATRETFEAIRVGAKYDEVMANRDRFFEATRSYGSQFVINHCVMTENWHELGAFLVDAAARDMDVHAIPVVHPPASSLYQQPLDVLEPIIEALEGEGPKIRADLGRHTKTWDEVLDQLRRHADQVRNGLVTVGTPVSDPVRRKVGLEPAATHESIEELRAWSGHDLIEFEVRDGAVCWAEAPDWAGSLDADNWVGLPAMELMARFGAALGEPTNHEVDTDVEFVSRSSTTFGSGDDAVVVRSYGRTVDDNGAARELVSLAIDDPAPLSGRGSSASTSSS